MQLLDDGEGWARSSLAARWLCIREMNQQIFFFSCGWILHSPKGMDEETSFSLYVLSNQNKTKIGLLRSLLKLFPVFSRFVNIEPFGSNWVKQMDACDWKCIL